VENGWPRLIGLASLSLSVVLFGASAFAQTVELVGDSRVTVRAEGVILVNLLRELESVVPIEQILLDPAVDGKLVSIALEEVTFQEAIEEILAAAEVNYAISGKDKGPFRIFAGSQHPPRPVPLSERAVGLEGSAGPGGSGEPEGLNRTRRPPEQPQTPERPNRTASGEAYLRVPPDGERLAMTLAILLTGFLASAWLLGPLSHRARSRCSDRVDEPV